MEPPLVTSALETVNLPFLPRLLVVLFAPLLLLGGPANAFVLAMSQEEEPAPLQWDLDDGAPIVFRHHALGADGAFGPLIEAATRRAMMSWAGQPGSDISFREGPIMAGPACPHSLPPSIDELEVCGGSTADVDGDSSLFFIESSWPYGEEVIALTSVSYESGGRVVDADIAFNGQHYRWSVGADRVRTDFESIVLHELGHLLGLDHTPVPDAVMNVDYEEGELNRILHSDDAAGVATLYPCGEPPCQGSVGYQASEGGCGAAAAQGASSWRLRAAALPLLLLALGCGLRRRSWTVGLTLALGLLLVAPVPGESSTVAALSITDLAQRAQRVLRAQVVERSSWRDGIVWSQIELDVHEDWKGGGAMRLHLVQPGGFTGSFGTMVFGMPRFAEGEEVVLFLSGDEGEERVLGLAQGKFSVHSDGTVKRDLGGMRLARVGGHRPPVVGTAPRRLEQLEAMVRGSR